MLSLGFLVLCLGAVNVHAQSDASNSLTVDLGYEIYQGYYNDTSKLNEFKGMRYAAPVDGANRWQAPKPPAMNRNQTLQANAYPPRCPQAPDAPTPQGYNYTGTEDCLYLSVQAPANATNLPVLVWIHGGGYGAGQGNQDLSYIINTNDNGFVGVAIQYRLGAFGFLAGDEVYTKGVVNAGLLDQHFALEWVQTNIHLFGGDPTKVTISGESAGAGSVMLQGMAYGGTEGTKNFNNIIAASPYLPMQYNYSSWQPSQAYYSFAAAAGCFPGRAYGNSSTTIFQCLVSAPSTTLQEASANISGSGTYGTWAFLPVTDNMFIQSLPSKQLLHGRMNGLRVLSGNNANEGPLFVIQNLTSIAAFEAWTALEFPLFNASDLEALWAQYPAPETDPSAPRFATTGTSPPTALNVSEFATGQQQRANNLYAETTFVCPSYWLAQAYPNAAYKYQYSVPAAQHGADVAAELGPTNPTISPAFSSAMMQIWGSFVINNNPSISSAVANGNDSMAVNAASTWPVFSRQNPMMLNLNQTGGMPESIDAVGPAPNVTVLVGDGRVNEIVLVQDAWAWEGGRGYRCDYWAGVGPMVPE